MKRKALLSMVIMLSFIFAVVIPKSIAQSNPRYIQFSPNAVKGVLYTPDSGPVPHVAAVLMHRTDNYMGNLACTELAKRGFMVLGMNPRSDNNEALVRFETLPLDLKQGVDFLRKQPGITKVVLWGHSGGGATMTFYQAVAEKGPSFCQGPNKLVQCGNDLAGLPRADGLILVDAHPGNPVIAALRSVNPAVVSEERPDLLKPELDPFDPKNGYNPSGPSHYSEEFKERYFKAQAERLNRLIDAALRKVQQMKEGKYIFPDDDAFVIGRGYGAMLFQLDLSILHSTVKPQKLLKNDGTIATQIVESVRVANPAIAQTNARFGDGVRLWTIRSFLSAGAIRATHSIDYNQIDWCSSNNSPP